MSPSAAYRRLDEQQIARTLSRLRDRIAERFPGSGLSQVADELRLLGNETTALVAYIRRPLWLIRAGAVIAITAMAAVLIVVVSYLPLSPRVIGYAEFLQAMDAALSTLVFLGATLFFLITLENRIKRRKALAALHQLRSVAHIVDMHQLTKDPERIGSPEPDTASSPVRPLTPSELGRYLDYCSELLSVISKLAALHVQQFHDSVTLAAVNEIETLTTGLSGKIWQKITLLGRGPV
jgi:hypothetical protein